jgi:hypothetical protein
MAAEKGMMMPILVAGRIARSAPHAPVLLVRVRRSQLPAASACCPPRPLASAGMARLYDALAAVPCRSQLHLRDSSARFSISATSRLTMPLCESGSISRSLSCW